MLEKLGQCPRLAVYWDGVTVEMCHVSPQSSTNNSWRTV